MTKALPAALMTLALFGAGCGSDTTSQTTSTSSAGTTARASTTREKAVKFAACVRAHGVADFPDPNADDDFDYGISVSAAVWTRAVSACKSLQPPGTLSSKRTPNQQKATLTFAQCIRAHGVKDFPDPVQGEPVINTYKIPSTDKPGGMAILNAATAKCSTQLRAAVSGK